VLEHLLSAGLEDRAVLADRFEAAGNLLTLPNVLLPQHDNYPVVRDAIVI